LIKSFRLVPASVGPRREFKITLGLRAGYGSAGRIYDLEEAVRTAHRWMWERAARREPFLSGMFTRGEVVYADSGGEAASHREPVAIFAGEVLPQYSGDLDDDIVREGRVNGRKDQIILVEQRRAGLVAGLLSTLITSVACGPAAPEPAAIRR
jgi:hypothetical protein